MLNNNKVLLVLSLLISIALWFYVMGSVDPAIETHINGVKVTVEGQQTLSQQSMTAEVSDPKTVSIVVVGKRSEVNKAKKKGFEAYVDVSECEKGHNEVKVHIEIPDGVSGVAIDSISQEYANVTVK